MESPYNPNSGKAFDLTAPFTRTKERVKPAFRVAGANVEFPMEGFTDFFNRYGKKRTIQALKSVSNEPGVVEDNLLRLVLSKQLLFDARRHMLTGGGMALGGIALAALGRRRKKIEKEKRKQLMKRRLMARILNRPQIEKKSQHTNNSKIIEELKDLISKATVDSERAVLREHALGAGGAILGTAGALYGLNQYMKADRERERQKAIMNRGIVSRILNRPARIPEDY